MANYWHLSINLKGPAEQIQELIGAMTVDPGFEYDITLIHPVPEPLLEIDTDFLDSPEPHQNWDVMLNHGQISRDRYEFLCDRQRKEYVIAQKNLETYGHKNWHSWTNENWGTKWVRTNEVNYNTGDNTAVIETISAELPPIRLVNFIKNAYPDITVTLSNGTHEQKEIVN